MKKLKRKINIDDFEKKVISMLGSSPMTTTGIHGRLAVFKDEGCTSKYLKDMVAEGKIKKEGFTFYHLSWGSISCGNMATYRLPPVMTGILSKKYIPSTLANRYDSL